MASLKLRRDGQTEFDNVDLGAMQRIEVLPGGGVVAFDRFGIGGSVKYAWDTNFDGFRNRFMLDVDTQYQIDNRRRFNNNGKSGKLRFHQDEEVMSVGPFYGMNFISART